MHNNEKRQIEHNHINMRCDQNSTNEENGEDYDIITLSGCGKITQWRFPDDLERCPLRDCLELFDDRFEAIDHYKKLHAKKSILCYLCGKPVYTNSPKDFEDHFRSLHPDDKIPFQFNYKIKKEPFQNIAEEEPILLYGCGKATYWRFPYNITRCPVSSCQGIFHDRTTLRNHFIVEHAKDSIMCSSCNPNKPIFTCNVDGFNEHYRQFHTNEPLPFPPTVEEAPHIEKNDSNSDDIDLIELTGGGLKTQWIFPQEINHCPVFSCRIKFRTRLDAIEHYKEQHAKTAIFCPICKVPIRSEKIYQIRMHYLECHPGQSFTFSSEFQSDRQSTRSEETVSQHEVNQNEVNHNEVEDEEEDDYLITLRGCGQLTFWEFPKNLQNCPTESCQSKFDSRSDAIHHYMHEHSKNDILCSLCNFPISAVHPKNYEDHYRIVHPSVEMPYNFYDTKESASKYPTTQIEEGKSAINDIEEGNDDVLNLPDASNSLNLPMPVDLNDEIICAPDKQPEANLEVDDLITLEGCGQTSQWRFPQDITHCPFHNCTKTFEFRSAAIQHYREQHAKNAILCLLCDRPISMKGPTSVIEHYREAHTGEPLAPNNVIKERRNQSVQHQNAQNGSNDIDDDLITLEGCGQNSQWRFPPNTSECPMHGCNIVSETRSLAIEHFKTQHAKHSVYCTACVGPVSAESNESFISHYKKSHPIMSKELPILKKTVPELVENDSEVDDLITLSACGQITKWRFPQTKSCPVLNCHAQFELRSKAISHYKKNHAKDYIHCPKCDKPIKAIQFRCFVRHYELFHLGIEVPINSIPDDNEEEDLITLRGADVITHWRFPPNLEECPIRLCNRVFDNRSDAIEHYKIWHAPKYLFCSICDRPVPTHTLKNYKEHFQNEHPEISEIPKLTRIKPIYSEDEESEDKGSNDHDDEDVDDRITLRGCGITTQWKFPDTTDCPNSRCNEHFPSRSKAIIHYKQKHADITIYCPLCDTPVAANYKIMYLKHHHKFHKNQKIPYNFGEGSTDGTDSTDKSSTPTVEIMDNPSDHTNEVVDDLIKLEGSNLITYWKFPKNLTCCPYKGCKEAFQNQSSGIVHYQKIHAPNMVLCKFCDKPVLSQHISSIVKHIRQKHAGEELPDDIREKFKESEKPDNQTRKENKDAKCSNESDLIELSGCDRVTHWRFPQNVTRCPHFNCKKELGDRLLAIAHFKRLHAKKAIFCSVCNRSIGAIHLSTFMKHCKKRHPNEKPLCLKDQSSSDDDDDVDDLIILGGGDQISQWHFPKTKLCPVRNCSIALKSRGHAIRHYRYIHTPVFMFCPLCDHADVEVPSKDDDLIILKGGGGISQWRFPQDQITCPIRSCSKLELSSRAEAILHYRKKHALNYQYCAVCDIPIPTYKLKNFSQHYREVHSNEDETLETRKVSDDDEEDDWIVLTGDGQITQWQFPKKAKTCPVKSCAKQFGVRSDVIDHYRKRHATNHIYCRKCDKPISMHGLMDFNEHYRKVHPNEPLPNDFDESFQIEDAVASTSDNNDLIKLTGGGQITHWRFPKTIKHCPFNTKPQTTTDKVKPTSRSSNQFDDTDKMEDLIILEGGGLITQWQFPEELAKCPVEKCGVDFTDRSEGIKHYRNRHTKNTAYCLFCDMPVPAKNKEVLKEHYYIKHPEVDAELNFNEMPPEVHEMSVLRGDDDDEDDEIELKGMGRISHWKFPLNLKTCPTCHSKFGERSAAIDHYRKLHAKDAVYCSICDKPISSQNAANFKNHFLRMHPEVDVKSNFNDMPSTSKDLPSQKKYTSNDMPSTSTALSPHNYDDFFDEFFLQSTSKDPPPQKYRISNDMPSTSKDLSPQNNDTSNDMPSTSKTLPPKNTQVSKPLNHSGKGKFQEIDPGVITLTGCGLTTKWQFPDRTVCPVQNCKQNFNSRLDTIAHYRAEHAKNRFLCSICKKPISVRHPRHFEKHYSLNHPGIKSPFDFNDGIAVRSKIPESLVDGVVIIESDPEDANNVENVEDDFIPHATPPQTPEMTSSHGETETEDENDTIELKGLGKTTLWKFPNSTICPESKCEAKFVMRSDAIDHYKKWHSMNAVYCDICDKPFAAHQLSNVKAHFTEKHPDVDYNELRLQELPKSKVPKHQKNDNAEADPSKKPQSLSIEMKKVNSAAKDKNIDENMNDDLITLSGAGKITHWHFPPNVTSCPNVRCNKNFKRRSHAIAHYKEDHAKNAIFCPFCLKPVSAPHKTHFEQHYKRKHPKAKIPYDLIAKSTDSLERRKESTKNDETSDLITLTGCGQITQWRFPKIRRCSRCSLTFESRLADMNHYKKKHAMNEIFCGLCNRPVATNTFRDFSLHFRKKHPGKCIPFKFQKPQTLREQSPMKEVKHTRQSDVNTEAQNEDDDIITLETCGVITKWRFPQDIEMCPVNTCKMNFKDRKSGMAHYKTKHAQGSFYCSFCDKPFRIFSISDLKKHYEYRHENVKIPSNFGKRKITKIAANVPCRNQNKETDDEDSDLIALEGMEKVTMWPFPPKLTNCPVRRCSTFKNRRAAIAHYKKVHAKNATLCSICNRVINSCRTNFNYHMKSNHPNAKDLEKEQALDKIEETKSCATREQGADKKNKPCPLRHKPKKHISRRIVCPLTDCSFVTKEMKTLRAHWNSLHGHFKFPDIRQESGFTYNTSTSSDEEQNMPNKRSKSNSSSDTESDYQPETEERRIDSTESSEEDEEEEETEVTEVETETTEVETEETNEEVEYDSSSDDEPLIRLATPKKTKKRRFISNSSTNEDSSDSHSYNNHKKRRKLGNASCDTQGSEINESGLSNYPRCEMLAKTLPKCSVALERLSMNVIQRLTKSRPNADQEEIDEGESSNPTPNILEDQESPMDVEMDYDEPDVQNYQEFIEEIEPDSQIVYEDSTKFEEPTSETAYNGLAMDLEPPEILMTPNPLLSIVDVQSGCEFFERQQEEIEYNSTVFRATDDEVPILYPNNIEYANDPMIFNNLSNVSDQISDQISEQISDQITDHNLSQYSTQTSSINSIQNSSNINSNVNPPIHNQAPNPSPLHFRRMSVLMMKKEQN